MALDKDVSYTGQNKVDTLSSSVRIDEGLGHLIVKDATNNRMIIGADPDGNIVIALTKLGEDIFNAYS